MLPKTPSGAARKRIVFLLGALLAVNAAVAHTLTGQIASATAKQEVKDQQVVVEEASEVSPEETTEGEDDGLPEITFYTVQKGDTISGIAEKFGIKPSTIYWANNLTSKSTLKIGMAIAILPIDGITYTVAKGDTISGIARKFRVDGDEILSFNNIEDPKVIKPGLELIIPDAEPLSSPKPSSQPSSATPVKSQVPVPATAEKEAQEEEGSITKGTGKFINPAPGSVLTQGLHDVNAVDFGAPTGTAILAADSGIVIVAKGTGAYNGGFGNFIVINHGDGVQTLYAHLSKVEVSVGDSVKQGERIGLMGSTGKSTGPHLHFEIHGTGEVNPWAKDKKYTKY